MYTYNWIFTLRPRFIGHVDELGREMSHWVDESMSLIGRLADEEECGKTKKKNCAMSSSSSSAGI